MAKVVVGLSGGVDSSVAAYLLKEQGHEVIGVFMQNWDPALNNDLADPYVDAEICQAQEDFNDAKSVADNLGIPIHKVDFVQEYWDQVFMYFLEEHKKGRTPNPDIFCNKYIKFKAFLDYSLENFDCDYIAMGHYAQVEHKPEICLLRGNDKNKDQTYFLEQLSREQLEKSLFPIGHLTKPEVRKIASDIGLSTANKKDSTGICFIGERNFANFLASYIPKEEGNFVEVETKQVVGKHKGLTFYTIGQRRGLGIGGLKQFDNAKWYVVGKDIKSNTVFVAQDEQSIYLQSNECVVENVNYISKDLYKVKTAKFRYRSEDVKVKSITWIDDKTFRLEYNTTLAVTPGQACVLYADEECLGGGEISSVSLDGEKRVFDTLGV